MRVKGSNSKIHSIIVLRPKGPEKKKITFLTPTSR